MTTIDPANDARLDDRLQVGTHTFASRLIVGTGKYATYELMRESLDVSGTECITVAVRRERLIDAAGKNLLDFIDTRRYTILPNTAGCFTADDAVRVARLGREILSQTGQSRRRLGEARSAGRHARRCCPTRSPRSKPPSSWWPRAFRCSSTPATTRSSPGG